MFRNGIYKITYGEPASGSTAEWSSRDHALAVMREGKLIGADRYGAVFVGEPVLSSGPLEAIRIQLTIPPGGELVNGFRAGPQGASMTLRSQFDPAKDDQSTIVDFAGADVALRVQYLGPLPE